MFVPPTADPRGREEGSIDSDEEERRIEKRFGYSRRNFADRLGKSTLAVERVSRFFEKHGVRTHAPGLSMRENLQQIARYGEHEYDLGLVGTPFVFEIKSRPNLRFTCARDFPYPDVSVDTVSGYRSKVRKPLAYLTVSGDLGSMLVLPTFTCDRWRTEIKTDHDRNLKDSFYFAAKELFTSRRSLVDLCRKLQCADVSEHGDLLETAGYPTALVLAMRG